MKNLTELFLAELADVYSAEQQLVKALPKVAEAATSSELKEAVENHLEQTQEHVRRLEQVFELFDTKPKAKRLRPGRVHRKAVLDSLPSEQQVLAEQVYSLAPEYDEVDQTDLSETMQIQLELINTMMRELHNQD